MSQIGFAIQSKGFAKYTEKADSFEAHEAIIDVVKTALAGVPGALPLVLKTLESLKSMSEDSPWITLFHRESRSANTARFQLSLADSEPTGSFLNVFAFGLTATANVTQVLFFKFKKNESTLQHNSSKLTINDTVLAAVHDDIALKSPNSARTSSPASTSDPRQAPAALPTPCAVPSLFRRRREVLPPL